MKKVLITGASGNLGQQVVDRFLADPTAEVIVTTSGTATTSLGSKVRSYAANLTDEASATRAVEEIIKDHQTLDAAILLVGGFASGSVREADGSAFRKMVALNFETAYYVARPVFLKMMSQPTGGRIVLMGARPALRPKDGKNMMAYALSKSLLFKLAELLNAEGASNNVITSVIVPSTIDTVANRQALPTADFSKWVDPKDIADAIFYLCSDSGKSLRETVLKMYGQS